MRSVEADKTTRARIRDAAVLRFAREGFTASVRSIAADAGVSAALVIHHFGSKEALRKVCDERVLAEIRTSKHEAMDTAATGRSLLHLFAEADEKAPLLGYVLRSVQEGSTVGAAFVEQMIDDAVVYTEESVKAGLVHPSIDEPARARYLTLSALGALMLELTLDPPAEPGDLSTLVRSFLATGYTPMLELYTQGLFTTRRMLDEYLLYVPDPPRGDDTDRPVS